MALESFLIQLFSGNALVPQQGALTPTDLAAAEVVLREFENDWRDCLAGNPPPLEMSSALWGAEQIFHWCRLFTYRDLTIADIHYASPGPAPSGTAADQYSVDLTARFLPDLL